MKNLILYLLLSTSLLVFGQSKKQNIIGENGEVLYYLKSDIKTYHERYYRTSEDNAYTGEVTVFNYDKNKKSKKKKINNIVKIDVKEGFVRGYRRYFFPGYSKTNCFSKTYNQEKEFFRVKYNLDKYSFEKIQEINTFYYRVSKNHRITNINILVSNGKINIKIKNTNYQAPRDNPDRDREIEYQVKNWENVFDLIKEDIRTEGFVDLIREELEAQAALSEK